MVSLGYAGECGFVGVKSMWVTCLQVLMLLLLQLRARQKFNASCCAGKPSSRSALQRSPTLS